MRNGCWARRTVLVVLVMLGACAAGTSGAAAAGPVHGPSVVGGPALASPGVVFASRAPAVPSIAAASWLVADLDTGEVLAAKDAHGRFAPASTLKTLTAVTLLPRLSPTRKLVPTFDDVKVDGSRVGVVERVGYPVDELMRAMLMVSGNDAANTLASAVGGTAATARLMNATAHELGALDTHAVNPHGLDAPGQVSSAYDLALFGRAGMALPTFARDVATVSSSISAPGAARIATRNHDKLLDNYPGALGIKNGYTVAARASFIGAAARGGHRILVTLMRADPKVFDEATKLLDWGFAARAVPDLVPVGLLVPASDSAAAGLPVTGAAASVPVVGAVIFGPALPTSGSSGSGPSRWVLLGGLALAFAAVAITRAPAPGATPARRRTSVRPATAPVGHPLPVGHPAPTRARPGPRGSAASAPVLVRDLPRRTTRTAAAPGQQELFALTERRSG